MDMLQFDRDVMEKDTTPHINNHPTCIPIIRARHQAQDQRKKTQPQPITPLPPFHELQSPPTATTLATQLGHLKNGNRWNGIDSTP